MTLTLDRDPITAPAIDRTEAWLLRPPEFVDVANPRPRRPQRPERRHRRWAWLAALLVAGLITTLIATADSADPPATAGTTVELEPVEAPEATTPEPTEPSAGTGEGEPVLGPLGGGDRPSCTLLWPLLCPEKTAGER